MSRYSKAWKRDTPGYDDRGQVEILAPRKEADRGQVEILAPRKEAATTFLWSPQIVRPQLEIYLLFKTVGEVLVQHTLCPRVLMSGTF